MAEFSVSIIVPVYNVEKFLDRCLESILKQTYHNIEIILVDDGSTDRSGILCDEYQRQDKRIKVIHKKNGGLSDARNAGIQNSIGDYIAFVDSDDYVHEEYVQQMVEEVERTNCDVVICGYIKQHENGENTEHIISPGMYDGRQIQKSFYGRKGSSELYDIACNKLYRKDIFENISFPKGRIHEDMFTSYRVLYQCHKIRTIPAPLYYYVIRRSSISQTRNHAEKTDRILVEKERMDFYHRHGEDEMFLKAQKSFFYLSLNYINDNTISREEKEVYVRECNALYRRLLSDKRYNLVEKMGILLAVVQNGGVLRGNRVYS